MGHILLLYIIIQIFLNFIVEWNYNPENFSVTSEIKKAYEEDGGFLIRSNKMSNYTGFFKLGVFYLSGLHTAHQAKIA